MKSANFSTGDTIKVFTKDPQDKKVHATPFEGTVIAIRGKNADQTFTVLKLASQGVSVERIFPMRSPIIEKVDVIKKGKVRRAKLFFLRKKSH